MFEASRFAGVQLSSLSGISGILGSFEDKSWGGVLWAGLRAQAHLAAFQSLPRLPSKGLHLSLAPMPILDVPLFQAPPGILPNRSLHHGKKSSPAPQRVVRGLQSSIRKLPSKEVQEMKTDSTATIQVPQDSAVLQRSPGSQVLPRQPPVISGSAATISVQQLALAGAQIIHVHQMEFMGSQSLWKTTVET